MKKLMMLLMISLLLVGSGMAAEGKLPELQAETVAEGASSSLGPGAAAGPFPAVHPAGRQPVPY